MSDTPKTRKSRQTLKNYFRAGSLPEEQHFHDLIDSTLNMEDEGFNKTPEDGLQVFTRTAESGVSGQSLVSFFREGQEAAGPLWRIRFDRGQDALQVVHPPDEEDPEDGTGSDPSEGTGEEVAGPARPDPLLSLAPGRRLGVNQARPEADLDVGGLIRSRARAGVVPAGVDPETVRADGAWHRITGPLSGCRALEVTAGVGGIPGQGYYALIHAVAMNAYQPTDWLQRIFGWKNRIKAHHAYFRSRADKLQLRWTGEPTEYYLEVRTRREYPAEKDQPPPRILFHVTQLWRYPTMRAPEDTPRSRTLPSEDAPDPLPPAGEGGSPDDAGS